MRLLAWTLLLLSSLLLTSGREPPRRVINVSTAEELQAALGEPLENVTLLLAPGRYDLEPTAGFDSPASHDCDQNSVLFPVSIGIGVTGKNVSVQGSRAGESVIVTNASYGIYFKDCQECGLERLTVTGTRADSRSPSAYGAIVAHDSDVRISHCVIRDNVGARAGRARVEYSSPAAICARSGANLTIEFNEMVRNSIGVQLFAGARAVVRNNVIAPFDSLHGDGIEIRCNAVASVEFNSFRGFGGISILDRADVVCRANLFERCDWAISAMSDDTSQVVVEKNAVYGSSKGVRLGGRGVSGRVSRNMVVENGIGVITKELSPQLEVRDNALYKNVPGQGSNEMFWRAQKKWTRTYRNTPVGVDGRHKFHESEYLQRYGRWLH